MVTVNALKHKNNKNENKMHFTCLQQCWQVLGTFKLASKDLVNFFLSTCHCNLYSGYLISFFWGYSRINLLSGRVKIYIPLKITSMKYISKMYRQYRTPHHENRARLMQHAGLHLIVGCCASVIGRCGSMLAFIGCSLSLAAVGACIGLHWLL